MIGIIGKKLGMTQIFNEAGQQIPCTVIEAEPNPVVQVLDKAVMGYAAVQLGHGKQVLRRESAAKERTPRGRRAAQAEVGHAKKAGLDTPPATLRSFRLDDGPGKDTGDPDVDAGRPDQGGHLQGGRAREGDGDDEGARFPGRGQALELRRRSEHARQHEARRPGSIGPGTDPSRVIKGKKMPGHYGDERHTQTDLRVEKIDLERNLIYLRGAVAGPKTGLVLVRKQG